MHQKKQCRKYFSPTNNSTLFPNSFLLSLKWKTQHDLSKKQQRGFGISYQGGKLWKILQVTEVCRETGLGLSVVESSRVCDPQSITAMPCPSTPQPTTRYSGTLQIMNYGVFPFFFVFFFWDVVLIALTSPCSGGQQVMFAGGQRSPPCSDTPGNQTSLREMSCTPNSAHVQFGMVPRPPFSPSDLNPLLQNTGTQFTHHSTDETQDNCGFLPKEMRSRSDKPSWQNTFGSMESLNLNLKIWGKGTVTIGCSWWTLPCCGCHLSHPAGRASTHGTFSVPAVPGTWSRTLHHTLTNFSAFLFTWKMAVAPCWLFLMFSFFNICSVSVQTTFWHVVPLLISNEFSG